MLFKIKMIPNILTNRLEILIHIRISITKNCQSMRTKKPITFCIFLETSIFKMLRTIQFNHKLCFCNIKVNYEITYYFLSMNHNG